MRYFVKDTGKGYLVCDRPANKPLKFMTINGDFVENRKAAYLFKDAYNADFCARQFKIARIRTKGA